MPRHDDPRRDAPRRAEVESRIRALMERHGVERLCDVPPTASRESAALAHECPETWSRIFHERLAG